MLSLLITLLILAVIVYVGCLLINMVAPTQPLNQILKIILGLVALVAFLDRTGVLAGRF